MSKKMREHHHPVQASKAKTRECPAEKPTPVGQKVGAEEQSQLIQIRAYGLWEQAGRPSGDADREQFWRDAEKEIMVSHARNE